jgi:hypothetical protein
VPMTSDRASRLGTRSPGGGSGVATRVPSAIGTRTASAWQPPTNSRRTHDDGYPARQLGQVPSEAKNEPITNWPGLTVVTWGPASSMMPQYSCPAGVGWVTGLMPR